ncbi:MAG: metal-sensing transcriptional repressor [Lachnospiraceae bacterium]|nr:metal-sensing transcriptional repressor [Lachnospiraceae bacterium]
MMHEKKKHTPRSDEQQKLLQNRLSRMIGQLNGISRMLEENRYCGDVLTQVAAVESALQSFGYIILQEHLESCVTEGIRQGNENMMGEVIDLVKKLK